MLSKLELIKVKYIFVHYKVDFYVITITRFRMRSKT